MSKTFCIYIVDDDEYTCAALEAILSAQFEIEKFGSAEACKARLAERRPDMFLLDISLPGMDGVEFCRALKDDITTREIPITFISGHDTIEARLNGYDAGAEDFIVKPFEVEEVLRKAKVAMQIRDQRVKLIELAQDSEMLSNLFEANFNEYAVLVSFLGKMAGCVTGEEVAEAMLQALQNYQLEGAVQIRLGGETFVMSKAGVNLPLEVSVMNHVRTMGRIFEFQRRGVYNFEYITVLINNMPLEDPNRCGRIRDNMAIAVQGADTRLGGIQSELANKHKQQGIQQVLLEVAENIALIKDVQQQGNMQNAAISQTLQEDLLNSFVHLGLTDRQETFLSDLVKQHMDHLIAVNDQGVRTQSILQGITERLHLLQAE